MSFTEEFSSLGDIALIILRSLLDSCAKKDYNKRLSFLLRCFIAGLFDFVEYGILLYNSSIENSTSNYVFYVICSIYGLYLIVLSICFCLSMDIHTFGSHLLFKCISLTMAIMLFETITGFDFQSISSRISNIRDDSSNMSISDIVFLISFYDIMFGTLGLFIIFVCLRFYCKSEGPEAVIKILCKVPDDVDSGWLIGLCFMPYRPYFSHITMVHRLWRWMRNYACCKPIFTFLLMYQLLFLNLIFRFRMYS